MKKFFSALFSLLLVMGLFSCSSAFNTGTYLTLNLGGKPARSVVGSMEVGYFDVSLISADDESVLFRDKFSNGAKVQIDNLKPGNVWIYIDAHNVEGELIGSGSKMIVLKNGQNKASITVTLFNEIFLDDGEVGSLSKPVTSITELQAVIDSIDTVKTCGIYVNYDALSFEMNKESITGSTTTDILIAEGKRVSLHFLCMIDANNMPNVAVNMVTNIKVTGGSTLTVSNDCEEHSFFLQEETGLDETGLDETVLSGRITVDVSSTLNLINVGFQRVHLKSGKVHLDGTKMNPENILGATNRIYTYKDSGNQSVVTLSNSNDAYITVHNADTEIVLEKNAAKNKPAYYDYRGQEIQLVTQTGGVIVSYNFTDLAGSEDAATELLNKAKPGVELNLNVPKITSKIEGDVDLNDYLFVEDSEDVNVPDFCYGKDGKLIREISDIGDLEALPSGTYYCSIKEPSEIKRSVSLKNTYTITHKKTWLTKTNEVNPKYIGLILKQYGQYVIEENASLTVNNIDFEVQDNEDSYTFDVKGKLVVTGECFLNNCSIMNNGSLTLNDCVLSGNLQIWPEAKETVLDGLSNADSIFIPLNQTLTLAKNFVAETPEYPRDGPIQLALSENSKGTKVIDNLAGITGLSDLFSLNNQLDGKAMKAALSDDGVVLGYLSSYTSIRQAIQNKQSFIPVTATLTNSENEEPFVIDYDATIAYTVPPAADTATQATINYSSFDSSKGSLFTVKNGAKLTLKKIIVENDTSDVANVSSAPLITVEEGGTLNAVDCTFMRNKVLDEAASSLSNFIDVYGTASLTGCNLENEDSTGLIISSHPLVYVGANGKLNASESTFRKTNNGLTSAVYANMIYALGEVNLDKCALSNIMTGTSLLDIDYDTDYSNLSNLIPVPSTNPMIYAATSANVTATDTKFWGNAVTRGSFTNGISGIISSIIHAEDAQYAEKCAGITLKDVTVYNCTGSYSIFTGGKYYGTYDYKQYANQNFRACTIDGISFVDSNTDTNGYNIYSGGDIYLQGNLNMPKGIFLYYTITNDGSFSRQPKLIKTGDITNATYDETNSLQKIPMGFQVIADKCKYDYAADNPNRFQILSAYGSNVKVNEYEAFNLFKSINSYYFFDIDGHAAYNMSKTTAQSYFIQDNRTPANIRNFWCLSTDTTLSNCLYQMNEYSIMPSTTDPVKLTSSADTILKIESSHEGDPEFALKGINKNLTIESNSNGSNPVIVEVSPSSEYYDPANILIKDVILGTSTSSATPVILNSGNLVIENTDLLSNGSGIVVNAEGNDPKQTKKKDSLTLKGNIKLEKIEVNSKCPIDFTEANLENEILTISVNNDLLDEETMSVTLPISGLDKLIEYEMSFALGDDSSVTYDIESSSVTVTFEPGA